MTPALCASPMVAEVFPSAANFLLIRCTDADKAFQSAIDKGLLVRDFRQRAGLEHCLRITIGTPEQNDRLLSAWGVA